jgi:hypothetical protein
VEEGLTSPASWKQLLDAAGDARSYGRWLIRTRRGTCPFEPADPSAVAADAAMDVSGVGPVLYVIAAGCGQCSLQRG